MGDDLVIGLVVVDTDVDMFQLWMESPRDTLLYTFFRSWLISKLVPILTLTDRCTKGEL